MNAGLAQPRLNPRVVVAGAAAASAATYAAQRCSKPALLAAAQLERPAAGSAGVRASTTRPFLPQAAMEALCGAIGEIAQIVFTYPLDTLKVGKIKGAATACTNTTVLCLANTHVLS